MSKTNDFEDAVLSLIFNNDNIANLGDATGVQGSTSAGSIHIALFTADPGEAASFTNETTYTSYARVAVARTSGAWTVSGTAPTQVENAASITFPQCTGGSATISHFAICKSSAGTAAGEMLYYGALSASLAVSTGITPQFNAGALVVEEA
jgi:hypothetical protein